MEADYKRASSSMGAYAVRAGRRPSAPVPCSGGDEEAVPRLGADAADVLAQHFDALPNV